MSAFTMVVFATSCLVSCQEPRFVAVQGLGGLSFPSSVPSDSANREFHRGLLLLHVFHYEDAAIAFREAERLEPDFALAYWGEAMTHTHAVWNEQDLEAGRAALARLAPDRETRRQRAPTPREKAWLETAEILYADGGKAHRDTLFAGAMERLVADYPDDDEARLFYALALLGLNQGVRDHASYMRAAALAGDVMARNPRHPGASHYLIHAVDDPEHAILGLHAAELLAAAAPGAGHAQHMTSHIFVALGMWDDAVAANERAVGVAADAARSAGRRINRCGHYNHWLTYGYLQQGRTRDAFHIVDACRDQAIASASPPRPADTDPDASEIASFTAMRTRLVIDAEAWTRDAARDAEPGQAPAARITLAFANGLAAARTSDTHRLATAFTEFRAAKRQFQSISDEAARRDPGAAEYLKRLDVLDLELQALDAAASGRPDESVRLLRQATGTEGQMAYAFGPPFVDKPAWELLGEELLRLDRPAEAGAAFETAIKRNPGRTAGILGLARAQTRLGNHDAAAPLWTRLTRIWGSADPDFAPANEARAAIALMR